MAMARKELGRAEQLLGTASDLLRELLALEQRLVVARRHMDRLGDLRRALNGGARDVPLMVRRALAARAGTHISQVIPLASRRKG